MFDEAALLQDADALKSRESALRMDIELYNTKILALTEEIAEKDRLMKERFRAKYAAKFENVNYKSALTGAKVKHPVKFSDAAIYFVCLPTGRAVAAVDAFVRNPVQNDRKIDPPTRAESMVLQSLVSAQLTGQPERPIEGDIPTKLAMLRELPAVLVDRLAEECATLQSWLNCVLELELGNS